MKDLGNFTIAKFHLGPKSMEKMTIFTQLQAAILGSFLRKNRACASNTFRATQKQLRFQYSGEFINVIQ